MAPPLLFGEQGRVAVGQGGPAPRAAQRTRGGEGLQTHKGRGGGREEGGKRRGDCRRDEGCERGRGRGDMAERTAKVRCTSWVWLTCVVARPRLACRL